MDLFCLLLNGPGLGASGSTLVEAWQKATTGWTSRDGSSKKCQAGVRAVQGVTAIVRQPYVMSMYQGSFWGERG